MVSYQAVRISATRCQACISPFTATCVRVRDGKRLVTDGPFAETKEQLGGFVLINVENLDEAIAIAARVPRARRGTAVIRPLMEVNGLPKLG